jgi:hypothetical protein
VRRFLITLAVAAAIAAPVAAVPAKTLAQQSTSQDGLVNVAASDLVDVQTVNIGAAVDVVASLCPNVAANVAALASEVDQSGTAQTVNCPATGRSITISQNNPGRQGDQARTPPGRTEQDGLVNVFAADLVDVRDVNVAAVVEILAGVCPNISADVAALAEEVDESGTSQTVTCPITSGPITISQNNPGRGR